MSKIAIAIDDIRRIHQVVTEEHPNDAELLSDMMEGETNLHALCSWAFGKMEEEDAAIESLNEQINNRKSRLTRAKNRKDTMRRITFDLLNAADQDKVALPEVTFSRRKVAPKLVVHNADMLPHEFQTVTVKPNMDAIKAASEIPDGVSMDNGGVSLSVRAK